MTPRLMNRKALVLLAAIGVLACGTSSDSRRAPGPRTTGAGPTAGTVSRIELSSPMVAAGERVTVTVTLSGPARTRSGAVTVYVGFDGELFAGPKEVRIPNGHTSASFTLYGKPFVGAARSGVISACTLSPEPYRLLAQSVSIIPARRTQTTVALRVAS